MSAPHQTRVIYLRSVAKFAENSNPPAAILRPTSVILPTNQLVAVLGRSRVGKTTLLRLLAKVEAPDGGEILTKNVGSPIVNSSGIFQPQLSGIENVRLIARLYGVEPNRLMLAAHAFNPVNEFWEQRISGQKAADRAAMEVAVTAMLPFDYYLIDNVAGLERTFFARFLEAATARNAGTFFATQHSAYAREFANYAIVIADHTLYNFRIVDEAIEFYERQPQ